MGGNALKAYGVDRVSLKKFNIAKEDVLKELMRIGVKCAVPAYVREKDSFGDLDVLVSGDADEVRSKFSLYKKGICSTNSNVDSLLYEFKCGTRFQVDLIFTYNEVFPFHYMYLCNNDLGGIIGRYARMYGVRLKHDGLYLPFSLDESTKKEVLLTKDYRRAMDFLEFDFDGVSEGFDTFEEMFQFVCLHPKFSPKVFENTNHSDKMRDSKRSTFKKLDEWIAKNRRYLDDFDWGSVSEKDKQNRVFECFPEAETAISNIRERHEMEMEAKSKVNGHLITQKFGLLGKDIGAMMSGYKELFPDWVQSTVLMTEEEILTVLSGIAKEKGLM